MKFGRPLLARGLQSRNQVQLLALAVFKCLPRPRGLAGAKVRGAGRGRDAWGTDPLRVLKLRQTMKKCGCKILLGSIPKIEFCPLHAAAEELLTSCQELLADLPYAVDNLLGECECGDYDEIEDCCHARAWRAVEKAELTT